MKQGARWPRSPVVAAAATGCWLLAYLPISQPWTLAVWGLVVLGVGLQAFRPLPGALLVLVSCLLCTLMGAPFGDVELLLPQMFVLFWLGRHQPSWIPGAVLTLGVAACAGARPEAPWYGLLVTAAVYSVPWLFGRVVRGRAREADQAADEAARLAGIDLARVMDNSARESRRRASHDSLAVMRHSVERMCRMIRTALRTGETSPLVEVRVEAESAIEELHRILSLLGTATRPVSELPARRVGADPRGTGTPWTSQAILITSAAAFVCVLVTYLAAGWQWRLVLLAIVVPFGALIARRYVLPAGVAVGLAFAVAALGPDFNHWALLPIEACLAALVWVAVAQRSGHGLAGFLAAFTGVLIMGAHFGKQGMGFAVVSVGITVVASRAWREKDERLQSALLTAARRTAEIATAALHADREERHRLARELHDGVSHGITAMTMQVQAAQLATDPAGVTRHLDAALSAGAATLAEIASITSGWQVDGIRYGAGEDVTGLIDGAREMGVNIADARVGECADPLVFHIVREALTNIVRYAPGARVFIDTGRHDGSYRIRIVDTGRAPDPDQSANPLPGLGTGLRGLADRVSERGGHFRAGPRARGFEVWAEWPAGTPEPEPVPVVPQPEETDIEPEQVALPTALVLEVGPGRPLEAV